MPELASGEAVVGLEVEVVVQRRRIAGIRAGETGVDVSRERHRTRGGVVLPEFGASGTVGGAEVELASDGGEFLDLPAAGAGNDVGDEDGLREAGGREDDREKEKTHGGKAEQLRPKR